MTRLTRARARASLPVLAALFLAAGHASAQAPGGGLVPATGAFSAADDSGNTWILDPASASVRAAGNTMFEGTGYLSVNGAAFRCNQPQKTADGKELVCALTLGDLEITRRVRLDAATGILRYVDSVRNRGAQPQTLALRFALCSQNGIQEVISDRGRKVLQPGLQPEELGILLATEEPNFPSLLGLFTAPRARLRPTVRGENSSLLGINWSLPLAPGATATLVHGVALRPATAGADVKTLAGFFRPARDGSWLRGLPREARRTAANLAGAAGFGGAEEIGVPEPLPADLAALGGLRDTLALGGGTRLTGVVSWKSLIIETRRGPVPLAPAGVAALVGARRTGGDAVAYLPDGQVLYGTLRAEGLRFALPGGAEMTLRPGEIDRLVIAAAPPPRDAAAWGMIETAEGERLAVRLPIDRPLHALTPWGERAFAPAEIRALQSTDGELPGHRLLLRDGSSLFLLADDAPWKLESLLFGPIEPAPRTLRALWVFAAEADDSAPAADASEAPAADAAAAAAPTGSPAPRLALAGENTLVAAIDLAELRVRVDGAIVALPLGQVRGLFNDLPDPEADDFDAPSFRIELWEGGTVCGVLVESALPVRAGDWTGRVPVRDILEASVSALTVPAAVRTQIAAWVRDLGDPAWEKREEAERRLGALGEAAQSALEDAADHSADAEVRKRARRLLEGGAR